ncbi:JmjC domain-containing protein [Pseudomonas peli]|uniref:JmjC domain-containing protein n=1 Tax=Pseudomonas peli TaxID=592361 RepID=UPI0024ACC3BE|nr:cupin domain-containing protein [Pseudomonas peli]
MTIDFKVSAKSFKKEYEERLPLVMRGAFDASGVRWSDINDIIARCDPSSENFRVSFPGGNVAKEKYVRSCFHIGDLRRELIQPVIYDYLRQGGTVVANHIYNEPAFNDFAKEVAQFTGRQTVTSAYVAFGKTDSYRAHWDSRDVFAVQLKGRKRWVVYEPSFPAPLYMHQSKYLEQEYPCPDKPYLDFVLEEGDIFYIPRGWWHNVSPLDEPTVHLAIGTFPAFGVDYVRWVFGQLPHVNHARAAMENFERDAGTIRALSDHISQFMNDPANFQAFIESHVGEQILDTRLNMEQLGDAHVKALSGHTRLRLNVLRSDLADHYLVSSNGKFSFKDELVALKTFVTDNPQTSVAEIERNFPEYSATELSELIHLLATQGVLEIF